eukprot:11215551-Lingulodinium_polyedra.AAC.1
MVRAARIALGISIDSAAIASINEYHFRKHDRSGTPLLLQRCGPRLVGQEDHVPATLPPNSTRRL